MKTIKTVKNKWNKLNRLGKAATVLLVAGVLVGGATLLYYAQASGTAQAKTALCISADSGTTWNCGINAQSMSLTAATLAGGESVTDTFMLRNNAAISKNIRIDSVNSPDPGPEFVVTVNPATLTMTGGSTSTFSVTRSVPELTELSDVSVTTTIQVSPN